MRLSRRQRDCLRALAVQGHWPGRATNGWDRVAVGEWAKDTPRVLRGLVGLGLVVDESVRTIDAGLVRAQRFSISDAGRALLSLS